METEIQLGLTAATFAQVLIALPLLCALLLVLPASIRENRPKGNRRRFSLRRFFSFRKVGGIYFLKVGRFGCSFWLRKK